MKVLSFVSALVLTLIAFSVLAAEISSDDAALLAIKQRQFEFSRNARWAMVQKNNMSLQEYNDFIAQYNYFYKKDIEAMKASFQRKQKQKINKDLSSASSDITLARADVVYKKDISGVKGVNVSSRVPTLDALAASNVCQNKFASQKL